MVNFIDLFIHAHPGRFGHVIYVFTTGAFYILFSIVYTLAGGTDRDLKNYIYSVIDWKNHTFDAIVFALATITFLSIMHLILTALVSLRIYVYNRMCSEQRGGNERAANHTNVDNLGFSA